MLNTTAAVPIKCGHGGLAWRLCACRNRCADCHAPQGWMCSTARGISTEPHLSRRRIGLRRSRIAIKTQHPENWLAS